MALPWGLMKDKREAATKVVPQMQEVCECVTEWCVSSDSPSRVCSPRPPAGSRDPEWRRERAESCGSNWCNRCNDVSSNSRRLRHVWIMRLRPGDGAEAKYFQKFARSAVQERRGGCRGHRFSPRLSESLKHTPTFVSCAEYFALSVFQSVAVAPAPPQRLRRLPEALFARRRCKGRRENRRESAAFV